MIKKDEQRFTISESNNTNIIKTVDFLRGDVTRSEACLKLLAYILQTYDVTKAILASDLTVLPPLPTPTEPTLHIETPIV